MNENVYFECRKRAAIHNERLNSRAGAAEILGISESTLAHYELGITKNIPVDVVVMMAEVYNAPELKCIYCKSECPIGKELPIATEAGNIEGITVRMLSGLEDEKIDKIQKTLLRIAEDGKVGAAEREELKEMVHILGHTIKNQEQLTSDQSKGLLAVITDYVYALDTLDKYDYQQLTIEETTKNDKFHATYENAIEAIQLLKGKFGESNLFAHEKDQSFKSSIATIYQTFDGIELYPSIEEKAAMLLYLVTKNHSFSDGNKRIAAMLFLWFMENNGILYRSNGEKRIADNTLVALTLMIAESHTEEKDSMVKVVVNLINQNN